MVSSLGSTKGDTAHQKTASNQKHGCCAYYRKCLHQKGG
jgi:hypothetical protein